MTLKKTPKTNQPETSLETTPTTKPTVKKPSMKISSMHHYRLIPSATNPWEMNPVLEEIPTTTSVMDKKNLFQDPFCHYVDFSSENLSYLNITISMLNWLNCPIKPLYKNYKILNLFQMITEQPLLLTNLSSNDRSYLTKRCFDILKRVQTLSNILPMFELFSPEQVSKIRALRNRLFQLLLTPVDIELLTSFIYIEGAQKTPEVDSLLKKILASCFSFNKEFQRLFNTIVLSCFSTFTAHINCVLGRPHVPFFGWIHIFFTSGISISNTSKVFHNDIDVIRMLLLDFLEKTDNHTDVLAYIPDKGKRAKLEILITEVLNCLRLIYIYSFCVNPKILNQTITSIIDIHFVFRSSFDKDAKAISNNSLVQLTAILDHLRSSLFSFLATFFNDNFINLFPTLTKERMEEIEKEWGEVAAIRITPILEVVNATSISTKLKDLFRKVPVKTSGDTSNSPASIS